MISIWFIYLEKIETVKIVVDDDKKPPSGNNNNDKHVSSLKRNVCELNVNTDCCTYWNAEFLLQQQQFEYSLYRRWTLHAIRSTILMGFVHKRTIYCHCEILIRIVFVLNWALNTDNKTIKIDLFICIIRPMQFDSHCVQQQNTMKSN